MNSEAYEQAQAALADLKSAVHQVLNDAGDRGLSVDELSGALGIGTLPMPVLELMAADKVVTKTDEGLWALIVY